MVHKRHLEVGLCIQENIGEQTNLLIGPELPKDLP